MHSSTIEYLLSESFERLTIAERAVVVRQLGAKHGNWSQQRRWAYQTAHNIVFPCRGVGGTYALTDRQFQHQDYKRYAEWLDLRVFWLRYQEQTLDRKFYEQWQWNDGNSPLRILVARQLIVQSMGDTDNFLINWQLPPVPPTVVHCGAAALIKAYKLKTPRSYLREGLVPIRDAGERQLARYNLQRSQELYAERYAELVQLGVKFRGSGLHFTAGILA